MSDSSEDRDEFVQIYLEESSEEIEQLIKLLLQLEENPEDVEILREVFRLLHTFKGSSGMMGYERINALAHELETRFDACRSGRERLTSDAVTVVLRCVDFFREFLDRIADGKEDQGDPTSLIEQLAKLGAMPYTELAASETGRGSDQIGDDQTLSKLDGVSVDDAPDEPAADATTPAAPATAPDEHTPKSTPDPVVATDSVSERGPVRELVVVVRLSKDVDLPDLKARLVVARLQALGDVVVLDPSQDEIEHIEPPITLNVQLRTSSEPDRLIESLDIDGVTAVHVDEGVGVKAEATQPQPSGDLEISEPAQKVEPADQPALPPIPATARGLVKVASPSALKRSAETIRVGIDRLDKLMNLAGELVVTNARFDQLADEMRLLFRSGGTIEAGSPLAEALLQAMSGQRFSEPSSDRPDSNPGLPPTRMLGAVGQDGGSQDGAALRRGWMDRGRRVAGQVSETVDQLARLSRSIQQAVLETRMVPIGPMFNRFRRTVRDIAKKQNKQVVLELEGEMTELDKRMVDELGDPMIHLIRNSLDHGIESSQDRVSKGKSPQGTVRLRAYHQSNHVVIEIEDDGRGIDTQRVRARALERGLATETELQGMSDSEIYGFIWHAGFSTADHVSDISGRGVGMDVVRERIQALGGVVELTSEAGIGSTVSIRLPLTLSIVNAMIVRFRGFRLAIPVTDVLEICGLSRSEIFESQGREMIDVRGKLLPLYRLDELFNWNDYLPRPTRPRDGLVQAVLVRYRHRALAIEVDDLDGNSDIVIKSLDEHFSHIPGLGGACVMGDGEVCLVLDTGSMELKAQPVELGSDQA